MNNLIAFHGNPAVKAKYQQRLREHHALDQIVQGTSGEGNGKNYRGCAVACTLHQYNHAAYETELGIPRVLARLEDGIFEGLPVEDAPQFAVDFLEAIHVGADLSLVWPQFAHWLFTDEKFGVMKFAKKEQAKAAIQAVVDLYARNIAGETVDLREWRSAADAADAASAASAAYAAYAASAADAAYAASAASAADAAYAAYAASAAYAAARKEHRRAQAAKLLELLKAAPVPEPVVA